MARFTLEEFSDRQPELVYIASNVVDAEYIESVFQEYQIDYAMNIETFVKQSLLGGTYPGVFFYVSQSDVQRSREGLQARGFSDTVIPEEQGFN